jgi:hypothetical protein
MQASSGRTEHDLRELLARKASQDRNECCRNAEENAVRQFKDEKVPSGVVRSAPRPHSRPARGTLS